MGRSKVLVTANLEISLYIPGVSGVRGEGEGLRILWGLKWRVLGREDL